MRIFKNVLKWLFIVFISITLIFLSFVVVGAVSGYNSASADDITPYSNDTVYPDNELLNGGSFSDYPTFNIMPYPYNSTYTTVNGITATAMGDGGVVFNGTADGNYAFYFIYQGQNIRFSNVSNYYTFNLNIYGASESSYYGVVTRTGSYSRKFFDRVVMSYSELTNPFNFYFLIKSGTTVSNLYVRPQINIGDVDYPYLPPYEKLMQTSYDSGYDSGKSDGLEQGSALADYSYFANCKVAPYYTTLNGGVIHLILGGAGNEFAIPNFVRYGITFDNIYDLVVNSGVDMSDADAFGLLVSFNGFNVPYSLFKPYAYNTAYPVDAFVNPYPNDIDHSITVNGSYSFDWSLVSNSNNIYTFDTSNLINDVFAFSFDFSNLEYMKDFVLYDSLGANGVYYQQGYEQGLKDSVITEEQKQNYINQGIAIGEDMGYRNGYELGYENGTTDGENKGYNKGFQDGSSGQLTAGNFFSRVLDILDVKLFGAISISDILTVSVGCMLVLFALKLFAGG